MTQLAGWFFGVFLASVIIALIIGAVIGISATGNVIVGVLVAALFIVIYIAVYIWFYIMAWLSIPVSALGAPPAPFGPNPVGNTTENLFRAMMIGMNVPPNVVLALAVFGPLSVGGLIFGPLLGPSIALWLLIIISLSAFPFFSNSRVFQGFIGWTGWVAPMSLMLTALGFGLFCLNFIFTAVSAAVFWATSGVFVFPFRIDWTSGVIESAGWGLTSVLSPPGSLAFTVGHFTFSTPGGTPFGADPRPFQGVFLPPLTATGTTSAHEVGHSLDFVAFGPIRWVLAIIDQSVLGNFATAYTELSADSRAPTFGGFQVNMWSA